MVKPTEKKRARKLTARITHLEMSHPPSKVYPVPSRPTIALMKTGNMQPSFYRYMYELVGKPHHWEDRRNATDKKLSKILAQETISLSVLYVDGCPAGFFELDTSKMPQEVEIVYFGLAPAYQGLGLGKWFLSAAISAAWSYKPQTVTLHTNTLDHPAALSLYQKLGFSPVAISEETVKEWL